MSAFFPIRAATEGLRVIRRERGAFVGWLAIWTVTLVAVAVLRLVTVPAAAVAGAARGGLAGLVQRFGPFWPVLVVALLVLWTMNTASLYRAVLRRDEHGWHLFKLGPDELRLALITALALGGLTVLGSLPMLALYVLAQPFFAVLPEFGRWILIAGVLATVAVEFWIAVRLSLTPVHTFAEGKFHLVGYWRLTEGQFWRLSLTYFLVAFQLLFVIIAVALMIWIIGLASAFLTGSGSLNTVEKTFIYLLALLLSVTLSGAFLVPLTILSASQACAYQEIVKLPAGPWSLPDEASRPSSLASAPTGRLARALVSVPLLGVAVVLAFNVYRRLRRDE